MAEDRKGWDLEADVVVLGPGMTYGFIAGRHAAQQSRC